jgi:hypothetical protein
MTNKTFTWIGVGLLILLGAFLYWGSEKIFKPAAPIIKSDTIKIPFDTTAFLNTIKPKIITNFKDTGSIKWRDNIILIPYYKATKADTIRDYNAFHETFWGKDTLTDDQNLFYEATHGITQNRLISFEGRYFWKHPETTINNNPIQPPKNQLYIGVKLDGLSSGFGIGGAILLKTRKEAIWGIGVDYIPILSKRPIYSISRSFKIKF